MRRRSGKHASQIVDEASEDAVEKPKVPKEGGHGVALALVIIFLAPILQWSIGNKAFRQTAWFLTTIGIAYLGVLFWRYKHWRREVKPFRRFVVCFIILLLELLVENFLCWVVSALDKNKYSYTPLQDLGEELLVWLCNASTPARFFSAGFQGMEHTPLHAYSRHSCSWGRIPRQKACPEKVVWVCNGCTSCSYSSTFQGYPDSELHLHNFA
mmetsp:Transcript_6772/g.41350  ORF Transcript_6772/g.41350 Transcript_6772/m.41350 type:complete len:212 (-) Transcript_6772:2020-2655(-)